MEFRGVWLSLALMIGFVFQTGGVVWAAEPPMSNKTEQPAAPAGRFVGYALATPGSRGAVQASLAFVDLASRWVSVSVANAKTPLFSTPDRVKQLPAFPHAEGRWFLGYGNDGYANHFFFWDLATGRVSMTARGWMDLGKLSAPKDFDPQAMRAAFAEAAPNEVTCFAWDTATGRIAKSLCQTAHPKWSEWQEAGTLPVPTALLASKGEAHAGEWFFDVGADARPDGGGAVTEAVIYEVDGNRLLSSTLGPQGWSEWQESTYKPAAPASR